MPISHEAAVARAKKAAATRAYNKAHGITPSKSKAPAFPKTYHATPTRHITHDLKMKELKPRSEKRPRIARSVKAVKQMSNAELQRQYNYLISPAGNEIKQRNIDAIYYETRDELARRAVATHGDLPRIKAHRARRGVRKQRGTK